MKIYFVFILILCTMHLFGLDEKANISHQEINIVKGIVFHDKTMTGLFDPAQDTPLEGIAVSNGREIAISDQNGLYELPHRDNSAIFVIKPRNWIVPVDEDQLPQFYVFHSTTGASGTKFEGLPPTLPLPDLINFPLYPADEPDKFNVLVFGDTQARNEKEVYYMSQDALPELIGVDAEFGITLGDIVYDNLNMFEHVKQSISTIGIPWHNVLGNHDLDFTANNDWDARGAFYRNFGPSWYSFSYGTAHFIVLDNIRWIVEEDKRYYTAGLGDDQMEFLRNELGRLDKNQLVFLLAHRPWNMGPREIWQNVDEKNEFFKLLAGYPNSVSLVSHTHRHYHHFLGSEENFPGYNPHHMISVGTICGAWWSGAPDEYGIPHAMMSDGTPTSYAFLHIDGSEWKMSWKAARRPAEFQMHVYAPETVTTQESAGIYVTAHIFNALPTAEVKMRIGNSGEWIYMEKISKPDPVRVIVTEREAELGEVPWRNISRAALSEYLWEAKINTKLNTGVHVIQVKAIDKWWEYTGNRLIHVRQ